MEAKIEKLIKLSCDYFEFMACAFPVMSLSDEFPFFPRAKKAIKYISRLDCLDREKIKQAISYITKLSQWLEKLNIKQMDLESQIDCQLLKQSMAGFLWEFEELKIWQNDPNLYLKIIILGIEQIVNKLSAIKPDIQEELTSLIRQIPRLLNEAKINLNKIPFLYQQTALQLSSAEIAYLRESLPIYIHSDSIKKGEFRALVKKAIQSLEDFKLFLKRKSNSAAFIKDKGIFENLLTKVFSYRRSLREIFEIAWNEYEMTKKQLRDAANHIKPSGSWQKILGDYKLKLNNKNELLNLYSAQIKHLRDFLIKGNLISIPKMQDIKVLQTPVYLAPIRASASYSCPLTRNQREPAFFYVSMDFNSKKVIWENIHQEYIFVTAHETYPGHHLLDSIRRNIKNPIRQQIESPLFYEGWASYAERLIEKFGYLNDLRQILVGLRRQAWRAIRAKLDVGIVLNKIKPPEAARELRWLGYSNSRIRAMLKHYLVTYGYQLCYTIGKFEIERLKKRFAPLMGTKNFHNCLLTAGQLPFDLIKKRMEKLCQKDS